MIEKREVEPRTRASLWLWAEPRPTDASYKRVSTQEQGRSGLGLEAQARDIGLYLDAYADEPWEMMLLRRLTSFRCVERHVPDRVEDRPSHGCDAAGLDTTSRRRSKGHMNCTPFGPDRWPALSKGIRL